MHRLWQHEFEVHEVKKAFSQKESEQQQGLELWEIDLWKHDIDKENGPAHDTIDTYQSSGEVGEGTKGLEVPRTAGCEVVDKKPGCNVKQRLEWLGKIGVLFWQKSWAPWLWFSHGVLQRKLVCHEHLRHK